MVFQDQQETNFHEKNFLLSSMMTAMTTGDNGESSLLSSANSFMFPTSVVVPVSPTRNRRTRITTTRLGNSNMEIDDDDDDQSETLATDAIQSKWHN